jgi:hypothetical protein
MKFGFPSKICMQDNGSEDARDELRLLVLFQTFKYTCSRHVAVGNIHTSYPSYISRVHWYCETEHRILPPLTVDRSDVLITTNQPMNDDDDCLMSVVAVP